MQALALYRNQSLGARLHTRLRAWSAPLEAVLEALPKEGFLLDVGCGHGLISNEASIRKPGLRILGIDVSASKIAAAKASADGRPGLEFRNSRLEDVPETGFDAVSLVDVLYLVPEPSWTGFLETCFKKLKLGGVFILKEIGTTPRWKFIRLKVQEFVSTRIIRITEGASMHFESASELKARLLLAGFEDVVVKELDAGYASPHVLLTARRPSR